MANPSKQGWRREGGRRSEAAAGKGWQSRKSRTTETAVAGHRVKLAILGLLVVALSVTFVVIVILWPRATPLIVVGVTDYPSAVPPNAYTQEDVARLKETNRANILLAPASEPKIDAPSLVRYLQTRLDAAKPGGPGKDVVLMYLSAHGVVDGGGEPCLLLSDANPLNSASWLKMRDVLEVFKSAPRTRKILLLDAGRIDDDWSIGLVYNGFAQQLEKLLAESSIPRLYVIHASSAGQRSWAAPELGGSVFGYFASRGLQGEASRNDNRITLSELTSYLTDEVSRYVREQRASEQVPRLLTPTSKDEDFALAYTDVASGATFAGNRADRSQIVSGWKRIHEHWKRLDDLIKNRQLMRQDPIGVAQIQRQLLRMEQLLLSGQAYVSELSATEDRVRILLDVDNRLRPPAEVDGYSFPLHQQIAPSAAVNDKVAAVLANWQKAGGKPPVNKDEPPPPPLDYMTAAQVGWRFLQDYERPRLTHLRDVLELVDGSRGRRSLKNEPIPDLCEILLLRMLLRYLDVAPDATDFSDAVRTAIHGSIDSRSLAEQAAAPADERVHYWIQSLVNAGDRDRRLAEDSLFGDPPAMAPPNAAKSLATYRQAVGRGDELARIYRLRDEVWNGLPYLAAWVLRSPDTHVGRGLAVPPDQLLKDVETLANRNHDLAAMLDQSLIEGKLDANPALQALVDEVRQAWQELRDSFVGYCQELKDRGSQDKPTLREIAGALRVPSPLVDVDERELLATSYVNGLFEKTELPTTPSSKPTAGAAGVNDGIRSPVIAMLAQNKGRLHPAFQLLRRNSFTMLLNRRERQGDLERRDESDVLWLARQGDRVRQWLGDLDQAAKDLEDDTKNRLKDAVETSANIRAGVSEADRLVRAAAALVPSGVRDSPRRLRTVDRHLQLLWHARRTIDDFWGPPPGREGSTSSYFTSVAGAYLDAARQFDDTPTSPTYEKTDLRELLNARVAAAAGIQLEPREVRTLGDVPFVRQDTHIGWHKDLSGPGIATLFFDAKTSGAQAELIPVKDSNSRDWRRQTLAVAESAALDVSQQIPTSKIAASRSERELTANLLYRGHRVRRPFQVRGPEMVLTSTVAPQLPPRSKVTVRGEGSRRAFITFILDCSGSMEALDNGVKRMEAAKDALISVVQTLSTNENYYVGLRAYSHRYKFVVRGNQLVAVDQNGQPTQGDPDRDVEILVKIDQLTPEQLKLIRNKVGELRENGVTPLYYSIIQALRDEDRDFRYADKDDLRHVIVITDGINQEQYKHTSVDDVLAVIDRDPRASGKVVDVVIFHEQAALREAMQAKQNKVRQDLIDIQRIAERTNGHKFAANNPEQLVESLRNALRLLKFTVAPAEQPEVSEAQALDLGRDKLFDFPPFRRGQYRVQLYGADGARGQLVDLQGGEAVELEYDKTGNRLVFPVFRAGDSRPLERDFIDAVGDHFRVIPILPKKSLSRVEFRLAVQNMDPLKFTPRPSHVWAEITPLDSSGQAMRPADVFYDAQFAPDTPVPVFQFVVNEWPSGSTQAAMQLWFKFALPPVKPNGEASIQSLERVTIPEDIERASFEAEIRQIGEGALGWRLTVIEKHDPGSNLFTARVQSRPTANLIGHRYYVGIGEARHVFDYRERPAPTVVVASRERVTENAIAVPRFVVQVKE